MLLPLICLTKGKVRSKRVKSKESTTAITCFKVSERRVRFLREGNTGDPRVREERGREGLRMVMSVITSSLYGVRSMVFIDGIIDKHSMK